MSTTQEEILRKIGSLQGEVMVLNMTLVALIGSFIRLNPLFGTSRHKAKEVVKDSIHDCRLYAEHLFSGKFLDRRATPEEEELRKTIDARLDSLDSYVDDLS